MFCKNCGRPIEGNSAYCSNCGQPINANVAGNNANYAYAQPVQVIDKSNTGLNALSYFVPIFGIIWYFVKRKERPREAKCTLKYAIAGFVVNFVLILSATFLITFLTMDAVVGCFPEAATYVADNETTYYSDEVVTESSEKVSTTSALGNLEGTEAPNKPSSNIAIRDYTVEFDGTKFKLPIELKEFENASGFRVKDTASNSYDLVLQPGEQKTITERHYQGAEVFLVIVNNSSSPQALGYCDVGGISQYANSGEPVTFAKGIQVGQHMTKSEVVSALGEPSDLMENNGYARLTYFEDFAQYGSKRMFVVTLDNGIVTEIIMQNLI